MYSNLFLKFLSESNLLNLNIKELSSHQCPGTDEWESNIYLTFLLKDPQIVNLYGRHLFYNKIVMTTRDPSLSLDFGDEIFVYYTNEDESIILNEKSFPVSFWHLHQVYLTILHHQSNGSLKNFILDEDIQERLEKLSICPKNFIEEPEEYILISEVSFDPNDLLRSKGLLMVVLEEVMGIIPDSIKKISGNQDYKTFIDIFEILTSEGIMATLSEDCKKILFYKDGE